MQSFRQNFINHFSFHFTFMFKVCDTSIFPGVRRLLEILALHPVTTATAERCFSTLKYLKNYLRSTCGQIRLNGLAHLYSHYNLPSTVEQVLDELIRTGNCRRLKIALKCLRFPKFPTSYFFTYMTSFYAGPLKYFNMKNFL